MKEITRDELNYVLSLKPGDETTAIGQDGTRVTGTVDLAARSMVWVHTSHGERKLLDIREYTFATPVDTLLLP